MTLETIIYEKRDELLLKADLLRGEYTKEPASVANTFELAKLTAKLELINEILSKK